MTSFQEHTDDHDVLVRVDRPTGRPREIIVDGGRILVTELESVRDETAAYPIECGPRQVFVVRAAGRRYRLDHRLRDGRWMMEEMVAVGAMTPAVA